MSKITRSYVEVNFETEGGYESRFGSQYKPGIGSLTEALYEIVRALIINGDEEAVHTVVRTVKERIERRREHAAKDESETGQ